MSDRPDPAWLALLAPLGGAAALVTGTRLARRSEGVTSGGPDASAVFRAAGGRSAALLVAVALIVVLGPWEGLVRRTVGAAGVLLGVGAQVLLAAAITRRQASSAPASSPATPSATSTPGATSTSSASSMSMSSTSEGFDRAVDAGAGTGLLVIGGGALGAGLAALGGLSVLGADGAPLGAASFALGTLLRPALARSSLHAGGAHAQLVALALSIAAALALGAQAAAAEPPRLSSSSGDPATRFAALALAVAGLGALGTSAARFAIRPDVAGTGLARALLRGPLVAAVVVALGARLVEDAVGLAVRAQAARVVPSLSLSLAGGLGLGLLCLGGAEWPVERTERGAALARAGLAFRSPWALAGLALVLVVGAFVSAGPLGVGALALSLAALAGVGGAVHGAGESLERVALEATAATREASRALAGPARAAGERLSVAAALLSTLAAGLAAAPSLVRELAAAGTPDAPAVRGLQVGLVLGALVVASTRVTSAWSRLAPIGLAAGGVVAAALLGGEAAIGAAALPALAVVGAGIAAAACVRSRPQALAAVQALAVAGVLVSGPARPAQSTTTTGVGPPASGVPVLRPAEGR